MWITIALMSFQAAAVSNGEALMAAEQAIEALWQNTDSYAASMEFESVLKTPFTRIQTSGTGVLACMKKDGKLLYRVEFEESSQVGEHSVRQGTRVVFDGEHLYTETESWGAASTTRTKRRPAFVFGTAPGSGKAVFERLRERYVLGLLPEESVDGHPCYVFDLTRKEEDSASARTVDGRLLPSHVKLFFGKETGILRKLTILFPPDDERYKTILYKDIRINVPFQSDRFTYTPPEGVTVTDLPDLSAAPPLPPSVGPTEAD